MPTHSRSTIGEEQTIGEIVKSRDVPDDTAGTLQWLNAIEDQQKAKIEGAMPKLIADVRAILKFDMLNMILPNGTRFGDAMPVDLIDYADKTMDELSELLVDPDDED